MGDFRLAPVHDHLSPALAMEPAGSPVFFFFPVPVPFDVIAFSLMNRKKGHRWHGGGNSGDGGAKLAIKLPGGAGGRRRSGLNGTE